MIKRWNFFMIKLWERCGYTIVEGNFTKKLLWYSIIDIILSFFYTIFSLMNLRPTEPSLLLFLVNFTILARFTLSSMIEMQKITDSPINRGKRVVNLIYIVKITIGLLLCFMAGAVFVWGRIAYGDFGTIKFVVIFVIITSFFENIWNIGERLYGAVPQPVFY